ncbi:MAG: serine/threonine protein kinase [Acidobacteria bacterium]|nr:serine/threonine protein kinase [Acidobacteriota bacterium]MBV9478339.1 serine/threonine protein kinase [Acidobacteriota bacterium]
MTERASGSRSRSLAPGFLVDGKYEIVGLLGAGGMGEVYKARHVHLGAFRCIKVMKPSLMANETYKQRFLREARLATQIHHPNVAAMHDFSILGDGTSYMVAEFIDGTTVRQWETANGRFPLALAVEVAVQVLSGLDHLHRRGLLHRDISADNVMLSFDTDDRLLVKIIDLGVAKDVSRGQDPDANPDTTQAGVMIGNPKYMSPEQLGELEPGETLDGRTDLYSLGIVLYEMLTGVPPFSARTSNGYIIKHLTEAPPTFADANPGLDLPAGLEAVVQRALAKHRNQRFPSARAFSDALSRYASPAQEGFLRTEVPTPGTGAEEAWHKATAIDTYNALRDFRARFPAHRVEEATNALAERLGFDTAAAIDTEDAWLDYLERWGEDRHAAQARERLEHVKAREATAYSVAVEMKSAAAWRAYLEEFPDARRSGEAESHLREALAFEEARGVDTVAAWGLFLLNYPAGLHEYAARERLETLEAADERAWEDAKAQTTPAALHAYLQGRPGGKYAGDAARALGRMAIVEGDFDAAWEKGTVAAWDEYIAAHPDGARIDDARTCRQEAQEYELAASMNTKVMWRAFLKAWPQGRHRLDAEVRLRS